MAKNKKKKKESIIPFVLCLLTLVVTVFMLPFMDDLFINKYKSSTKEDIEKNDVPTGYSCLYGPSYDELYKYTKDENIEFKFDKKGKVVQIISTTNYSTTSLENYQTLLNSLVTEYGNENIVTEETNHIIIVKQNTKNISNTKYPKEYNELKKYLSKNGYICSKK